MAVTSFRTAPLGPFLLDHTCRVWRKTEALGDYRETIKTLAEAYDDVPCFFRRRDTVISDQAPGTRPVGDRMVFMDTGPTIRDRDVVEITAGPEVDESSDALLLEVESVAVPRGHHIELRCVEYRGEVPEAAS